MANYYLYNFSETISIQYLLGKIQQNENKQKSTNKENSSMEYICRLYFKLEYYIQSFFFSFLLLHTFIC